MMDDVKPKKSGAKTKLTPELEAEFLRLLASGNYIKTACQVVGINPCTYQVWIATKPAFALKVERAVAKSEADIVAKWQDFACDDWRACKEFLAARHSKKWGRKEVKVEHTAKPFDANALLKELQDRKPPEQES